jgi:hypothetical protein
VKRWLKTAKREKELFEVVDFPFSSGVAVVPWRDGMTVHVKPGDRVRAGGTVLISSSLRASARRGHVIHRTLCRAGTRAIVRRSRLQDVVPR